jgi:hypothetical protein
MTRIIALLVLLPSMVLAQTYTPVPEGTHRKTFDGHNASSRADACKAAKDEANVWLDVNQETFGLYSINTNQGECSCDKPPSKIIKNVCPGGTPICDVSRLIDETVELPWHCIVDASVTKRKK